jgi:predicted amidohydrolase YtcJ
MRHNRMIYFLLAVCILSFTDPIPEPVDLMIRNAKIYTVDANFSIVDAMVIRKGRIVATGSEKELLSKYTPAGITDAGNRFIYPGFIDAHAHFLAYSSSLQTVNLTGTSSWQECLDRISDFLKDHQTSPGKWIVGNGWDQNDWKNKEFPDNSELSKRYPDNPVVLNRVDGHAVIANARALDLAGIKPGQKLEGGDIQVEGGKLTGILIDNATELVSRMIPSPSRADAKAGLLQAQQNCFAKGLTTIDDCGLDISAVQFLQSLQTSNDLKMRLYVMLSDNAGNLQYIERNGPIKSERMNVRSVKVYADGALGSRGACLLEPYTDKPGQTGFLLSRKEHFDSVAAFLYKTKFQMCTHAIGDSGNRVILNTYAKYLQPGNDLRWRIEHAQVVNKNDFDFFGKHSIIPSVQPTHATSDMYWAEQRLGKLRVKQAYAFKQLLSENKWIALGTDFPVEDIDPLKTFFAAVIRKDSKGFPEHGYQVENALTREEAIRGMTIWAAKSNYEENEKGTLEPGKFADFIILDKDLLQAPESEILKTTVLKTYINGELVHEQTIAK